jgi:hypothetical protein
MKRKTLMNDSMYNNETNPVSLLDNAIQEVNSLFLDLTKNFPVSYKEYEDFIQENDLELARKLFALWNQVDNDIYGRFIAGNLDNEKLQNWQNALIRWKELTMTAIKEFALKSYGQILSQVSPITTVEIAA